MVCRRGAAHHEKVLGFKGLPDHNVIVRVYSREELVQVRPRQLMRVLCTHSAVQSAFDTRQMPD